MAGLSSVAELIAEISAGRMIILVDDENRENEGDLFIPADCVTPEAINFMAMHGRGLICMPVGRSLAQKMQLKPMVDKNESANRTAFMVSIGARRGTTTGISAFDRAHIVKTFVAPDARPEDIISPGHVFPLLARDGGVLVRAGHTEAAVDLALLAGYAPAGVICEIMKDDGMMARLPDLLAFADRHGLKIGTIADIIAYRQTSERSVANDH